MVSDEEELSEWAIDSNEAVEIHLVAGDKVPSFHPSFTYALYGNEETIFGYKGLKIDVNTQQLSSFKK